MEQTHAFELESDHLFDLIQDWDEQQLDRPTTFKDWTAKDILRHLHVWNEAAVKSLTDETAFKAFLDDLMNSDGLNDIRAFEQQIIDVDDGQKLRSLWKKGAEATTEHYASADPKKRVDWVGPSMSARSSITARLMETWSHAQALFDLAGVDRPQSDLSLKNIAILGINTYGWTFAVNSLEPPAPMPYVELFAPSGDIWTFGDAKVANEEKISGPAEHFCQVVTQCRSIQDVNLTVLGENANEWMLHAQCFAGTAQKPPPKGTRTKMVG